MHLYTMRLAFALPRAQSPDSGLPDLPGCPQLHSPIMVPAIVLDVCTLDFPLCLPHAVHIPSACTLLRELPSSCSLTPNPPFSPRPSHCRPKPHRGCAPHTRCVRCIRTFQHPLYSHNTQQPFSSGFFPPSFFPLQTSANFRMHSVGPYAFIYYAVGFRSTSHARIPGCPIFPCVPNGTLPSWFQPLCWMFVH